MDSAAARGAIERLHRMCVGHAQLARSLVIELRSKGLAEVLPRARRLMLEARANLEQWRVAVARNESLEVGEREMIQAVMGVARSSVESGYSMVAKEVAGQTGLEAVELALRRTAQAMMAMLTELVKIAPGADAVADMRHEDLLEALRTRSAYARWFVSIEATEGSVAERLESVRHSIDDLIFGRHWNDLRVSDVAVFEGLIERIRVWRGDPSDASGEALWSEVESVGSLIRGINQREALQNHDRRVLGSLSERLQSAESVAEYRDEIAALLGLDAALDRLLVASNSGLENGHLVSIFERLRYLAAAAGV